MTCAICRCSSTSPGPIPGFLEQEPLASLVAKGEGFSEEDKAVVMAEHLRIVSEVIPLHTRLWNEGRIEVITTPLAHPILPLISDSVAGNGRGRRQL